jgi:hypothetical protein
MFKGTALQTASVASSYLFSFIIGPVLLARLGLAEFGVWARRRCDCRLLQRASIGTDRLERAGVVELQRTDGPARRAL